MDRRRTRTNCSFCGKPRDGSLRIIAGPGVFICADCVALCNEILSTDARPPSAFTASAGDPVEGVEARYAKPPRGERVKGWVRRFRLWRIAWSG